MAALGFAAAKGMRYIVRWRTLREAVLLPESTVLVEAKQLPGCIARLFEMQDFQVSKLGFGLHHHRISGPLVRGLPDTPGVIYVARHSMTYLEITPGCADGTHSTPQFHCHSFLEDHRLISTGTRDPGEILPAPSERWNFAHIPGASLEQIFAQHEKRVQELSEGLDSMEYDESGYGSMMSWHVEQLLASGVAQGDLESAGDKCWQFTKPGAWKQLVEFASARREPPAPAPAMLHPDQIGPPTVSTKPKPVLTPEFRAELDSRRFVMESALETHNPLERYTRSAFLLFSLMVCAPAFGVPLSFYSLLAMVFLVFLHETGHLVGMLFTGARMSGIMQFPFLMRLLPRSNTGAPLPWQELVIAFLGPLPGLLAGIVIFGTGTPYPPWIMQAAGMALVVNVFQLLPVRPLDGGHIADILIFRKWPKLGITATAFTGLGITFYGIFALHNPAFAIIGLLLLLGIGRQIRAVQLLGELRNRFAPVRLDEVERSRFLRETFSWMLKLKRGFEHFELRKRLAGDVLFFQPMRMPHAITLSAGLIVALLPVTGACWLALQNVNREQDRLEYETRLAVEHGFPANAEAMKGAPVVPARNGLLLLANTLQQLSVGGFSAKVAESATDGTLGRITVQAAGGAASATRLAEILASARAIAAMREFSDESGTMIDRDAFFQVLLLLQANSEHMLRQGVPEMQDTLSALDLCGILAHSLDPEVQFIGHDGCRLIIGRVLDLAGSKSAIQPATFAAIRSRLPGGGGFAALHHRASLHEDLQETEAIEAGEQSPNFQRRMADWLAESVFGNALRRHELAARIACWQLLRDSAELKPKVLPKAFVLPESSGPERWRLAGFGERHQALAAFTADTAVAAAALTAMEMRARLLPPPSSTEDLRNAGMSESLLPWIEVFRSQDGVRVSLKAGNDIAVNRTEGLPKFSEWTVEGLAGGAKANRTVSTAHETLSGN